MIRKDNLTLFVEEFDLEFFIKTINKNLVENYKDEEPLDLLNEKELGDLTGVLQRSVTVCSDKYLYKEVANKLSFILYTIVKSHFLSNGNKRTGAQIFITLLAIYQSYETKNAVDIYTKINLFRETANMTIYIAESSPSDISNVMDKVELWIKDILNKS